MTALLGNTVLQAELEAAGLGMFDYEELLDGLARREGLELIPAVYDAAFPTGGQQGTVRLTPDVHEGPFWLVRAHHSLGAPAANLLAHVDVQLSSRKITENQVPYKHLFGFYENDAASQANSPFGYPFQTQQMPCVVIDRGDVMAETIDMGSGAVVAASSLVQWFGFHMRKAGTHDRLPAGSVVDMLAKRWRESIGELYAVGLLANGVNVGGNYQSFQAQYNTRWQWLAVAIMNGTLSDIRIRAGGIELFPRGLVSPVNAANLYRLGNLDLTAPQLLEERIAQSVNGNVYATFVGARRLAG